MLQAFDKESVRYALPKVFFVLVLALFLLFPNSTHSVDAWAYAADTKFAENLFSPHHLFYNATNFLIKKAVNAIGLHPDEMQLLLALNGIVAWFSILILFYILQKIDTDTKRNILLCGIAAFSFGFWRFATENETYIFPMFFSLLATFFFLKHFSRNAYMQILLCGFFASIACLFHQLHVFWFLGFLIGIFFISKENKIRSALIYCAPFFIVIASYILVLKFYFLQPVNVPSLKAFVLHDVYSGAAGKSLSTDHFLLGIVNLFRTFFQVHGLVALVFKNNFLSILAALISVSGIFYFLFKIFQNGIRIKSGKKKLVCIFAGIFLAQYIFALYNVGNAEFMALLPALFVIILAFTEINKKALFPLFFALIIWNLTFGILPNHFYKISADEEIAEFIDENKEIAFIASEPALISNIYYYNHHKRPGNLINSPAWHKEKYGNTSILKIKTDSLLALNRKIFTDCTGRPGVFSRRSYIIADIEKDFFSRYLLREEKYFSTEAGNHIIYSIAAQ